MAERFQVAKRVFSGQTYREIAKRTGASTTTVTRVAHWLHHGMGGYRLVLERMRRGAHLPACIHPVPLLEPYDAKEIQDFLTICDAFGIPSERLVFDVSLARGLDYYTGVT